MESQSLLGQYGPRIEEMRTRDAGSNNHYSSIGVIFIPDRDLGPWFRATHVSRLEAMYRPSRVQAVRPQITYRNVDQENGHADTQVQKAVYRFKKQSNAVLPVPQVRWSRWGTTPLGPPTIFVSPLFPLFI
jgi:hypothetical protein